MVRAVTIRKYMTFALTPALTVALSFSVGSPTSSAQDRTYPLSYSGRLTLPGGEPMKGPVDIELKFWDAAADGAALSRSFRTAGATLNQGVFQIRIPMTDAEVSEVFGDGTKTVYVEVIAKDIKYPRQEFTYVPLALTALRVTIDNKTLKYGTDGKLKVEVPARPSSDSVLIIDGQGKFNWEPFTAAQNGPGSTSIKITAGSGLSGGTITNAGTISLATTGVTAGTYTRAQLVIDNTGRVTNATSGAAIDLGSDVSGTLPVTKGGTGATSLAANGLLVGNGTNAVQTIAPGTTGNTLTSNGTAWVSSAAPVASAANSGYLSASDWAAFSQKQAAGAYLTGFGGDVTSSSYSSGTVTTTLTSIAIPGTATKITYDVKGRILSGTSLSDTDIPPLSAAIITSGTLAVARGGTGSDLSTTGGTGQYLKQTSQGGAVTVGTIPASDITQSLGYTPLNKSGDTLGGVLNAGAFDVTNTGNIQMAASKTLSLGSHASDPAGLTAGDIGKTWFNATSAQIKYWNGTSAVALGVAGSGLSSLNGQTGNTQSFPTPGTTGTVPNWVFGSDTHTLNIPLASSASVTAGLLSNSEYTAFSNKVSGVTQGTGIAVSSASGTATVSLATAGTAGAYAKVTTDIYGRVTSGTTLSASDVPTLTTNQIMTSLGYTPLNRGGDSMTGALSMGGSDLTNAGNLQMASSSEIRFSEAAANGTNYVGFKAPSAISADKVWVLPSTEGSAGQVLKTDGAGNLGWVSAAVLANDIAAVENLATTGGVERTATDTWSTYTLTTAGKALLDDADASAQRATLGLGSLATASAVAGGSGGTITDATITDDDIASAANINDTKLATITTAGKVSGSAITTGTIAGSTAVNTTGNLITSGNIGIGTTNPAGKLDVAGTICLSGANCISSWPAGSVTSVSAGTGLSGGPITGSGTLSLANTAVTPGSYSRANITVDAQGRLTAAASGNNVSLSTEVTGTLPIANGGTGATTAANAFNALSPLTMVGDILYGGTSGAGTRLAGNTTTTKQFLSSTGVSGAATAPAWSALSAADIPAHSAALITSGTLSVANGGTGASTLAANNVLLGNGTDTPLTVAPGANGNVLTSNGTTWVSSAPSGGGAWVSSGSNVYRSSGNVGIGTTAPEAPLDVNGNVYIESPGSLTLKTADSTTTAFFNQSSLRLYNTALGTTGPKNTITFSTNRASSGYTPTDYAKITGGKENSTADDAAGYLTFSTTVTGTPNTQNERMRITSNGNVGIGTTTPTSTLQVTSGTKSFAASLAANATDSLIQLTSAATTNWARIGTNGSSLAVLTQGTDSSSTTPAMIVTNTGTVGIGTNSPAVALDVTGQIRSKVYNAAAGTSFDWNNGNIQYTTATCGNFAFTNMQEGASYTLIVKSTTQGTCVFTQTGLTFRSQSALTTATGTYSIFNFIVAGGDVFVQIKRGF